MRCKFLMYLSVFAVFTSAHAQEWPTKPVRMIVPFPAASTPDTLGRLLAQKLQVRLNQPFFIENRTGVGGMTGTDAVAKAAPDGYTLGVSVVGPMVNDKHLYKNMPYEPSRDITPITIAVTQPSLLVVRSGLPAKNLAELIAELRKEPGKFNYASIGNGSLSHLAMALIALKSGTEIVHVPYGGSSQAVLALVSAEADMACLPALSVLSQVKSGKVRILGASTATRSTLLPDIPTLAEQGLSGIDAAAWIGVIAPAKTPMALRDRIQREISTVLKDPVVVQALHVQMMEVVGGSPEAFTTFMREEDARYGGNAFTYRAGGVFAS